MQGTLPAVKCQSDCVMVKPVQGVAKIFEVVDEPSHVNERWWSVIRMSRHSMTSISMGRLNPIPVTPKPVGFPHTGWLAGCRYQWIDRGVHHGLRVGDRVALPLRFGASVPWIALDVRDDRAFGVYDVAQIGQREP